VALTVVHVLEALATGCSRHVIDVVSHTPGVDHVVVVPPRRFGDAASDTAAVEALRAAGADVHLIDMRRSPVTPTNAAALLTLRRLVREIRPTVVHGHSSIGGALARVAATGTAAGRMYTPNALATGRGPLLVERALGRLTDIFVAVSASEAETIRGLGIVAPERIEVIGNGIDPSPPPPADLRGHVGIAPGVPLVGTMGRLAWQKAPERFVAMAAAVGRDHPDAEFVMIGDGPLTDDIRHQIAERGLRDRVHVTGHLPEAARYLHDLDVFVLASRYEGGPYAPLEAMRVGVPVVLTSVVGSRDVVDDDSGILVPEHDAPALARAVGSLLTDRDRARTLGAAGRARLRERFDVAEMGNALAKLYVRFA
jgi:glycosyltransferase involved in cell wall biosynthesis